MREKDRQLGKPLRAYVGSQAAIEALSLIALDEGCVGYASDIDALGTFSGTTWSWETGGSADTIQIFEDDIKTGDASVLNFEGGSASTLDEGDGKITVTVSGGTSRSRPELNVDEIRKQSKPTQVQIGAGAFFGYSMPIYNSDNEELYFKEVVRDQWDGASDLKMYIYCCLGGAESLGKRFQLQLSWKFITPDAGVPETVPTGLHDVDVGQYILGGGQAQYDAYTVVFTIDYDIEGAGDMAPLDLLVMRLRRLDAPAGEEVTNEIIILDWDICY